MSSHVTVTQVNNITIFEEQVNKLSEAAGMGPLKPGAKLQPLANRALNAMRKNLLANWKNQFDGVELDNQEGSGVMGPLTDNIAGSAPKCVVDSIMLLTKGWNMPLSKEAATQMAETITNGISTNVGSLEFQHGTYELNVNEMIDWMVGYEVYEVTQTEKGVIYAFGAQVQ